MLKALYKTCFCLCWTSLILCISAIQVQGMEQEAFWWDQLQEQAREQGYELISTKGLLELYAQNIDFILIDVRYSYEFSSSRLPRALNLPFDLSHQHRLDQEQKEAFLKILGQDKTKKIVLYCRDFR